MVHIHFTRTNIVFLFKKHLLQNTRQARQRYICCCKYRF
uniref:Uncharacterized protein n=1 Tax=Arundo donax TaxID=35708 RepID=A0A0A9AM51_ARUDO